jgi:drug efflux transport system permease protein
MKLRRVRAIAACETLQLRRDLMIVVRALGVPLALLLLFGYGLSLDVEHIPFAVVDYDHSALSREYVYSFAANRTFDLRGEVAGVKQLDAMMRRGEIRLGMVIPPQFQRTLYKGMPERVQFLVDGAYPYRAEVTRGYALAVAADVAGRIFAAITKARTGRALALDPIDIQTRYLYNETLRTTNAIIPGLIPMILMMATAVMMAVAVVREKELGSIFNFLSSPATRIEFVVGKLLPYAAIGFADALILGAIAVVLYRVPFKGSLALYCVGSALFVIATASIGLLVSSFARSQFGAIIVAMIITMVPAFLYSGLLIPVQNMSPSAQVMAHLFPTMFFHNVVMAAYLKALPFGTMAPELGVLVIFILVYLGAGIALTRRREP